MQVLDTTPQSEITIAGLRLNVPSPYSEGHVLTEAEAKVLNQTLAENLRNNFAKTAKKFIEDAVEIDNVDLDAAQEALNTYIEGYEFGVRQVAGRATQSPVERMMLTVARERVKEAIKRAGHSLKQVSKEKIDALVEQLISRDSDSIREEAEVRIEAKKAAADSTSEKLDLADLAL